MTGDHKDRTILFTAFEPSGDDLGAAVTRELLAADPSLRICAWGGPRLGEAGAEILEDTVSHAVMGLPGPGDIARHLKLNKRIARFLQENRPDLLAPVDSPAANFPVCKLARRAGVPICHIAAPQLWAWGSWRIRKLRRLTDRLLCLLPFEEDWFQSRGVPAKFIGHPVFDTMPDEAAIRNRLDGLTTGEVRVALLPGSRSKEHAQNFPAMLEAFRRLATRRKGLVGVVSALDALGADRLRRIAADAGGWPEGLDLVVGDVEATIGAADLCIAVSGTVTLHIIRQVRPMVVLYRMNRLGYNTVGRTVLRSEFLSMPNLLAGRRIVPELMPFYGDPDVIVREVEHLLDDEEALEEQRNAIRAIREDFEGQTAAHSAAAEIIRLLKRLD